MIMIFPDHTHLLFNTSFMPISLAVNVLVISFLLKINPPIIVSLFHGRGLMLWLFVGPTGVYLLDFFCSGIQFKLLLSPYPCFISLLYLDLYVLGDDALIS